MSEYWHKLQAGLVDPKTFRKVEVSKRILQIQLSSNQNFECVHKKCVTSLDLDKSESRFLLSGSLDGSLYIHDTYNFSGQHNFNNKCIVKIEDRRSHTYNIQRVLWYNDNNILFTTSGSDQYLKIWDANTQKPVEKFRCRGNISTHHISPIPCFHLIAIATSLNHVQLYDIKAGSATHELRGHSRGVISCCWSPRDEYLLATGGEDHKLLLWDIRSSRSCLASLDHENKDTKSLKTSVAHSGCVNGINFTPDGLFIVSSGSDGLKLWETFNGNNQMIDFGEAYNKSKKNLHFDMCYDSNPALLFIPLDDQIKVLELFTGNLVKTLSGHFSTVTSCVLNNDYQCLYSSGLDYNILAWETRTDLDVPGSARQDPGDQWSSDDD